MSESAQSTEPEVSLDIPNPSRSRVPPKRPQSSSSSSFSSSPNSATAKKPRFTRPGGKRHGGVSYAKQQAKTSMLVSPRTTALLVFTSSLGLQSLTEHIYQWCVARDYRWGSLVPLIQFQYVTIISFISRMAQISTKVGYHFDARTSFLKQVTAGIKLPDAICKMIESLGEVNRPSLPMVCPLFPTYKVWLARGIREVQPATLLEQAGRLVPEGDWAIDPDYIADYIQRSARALSKTLEFRTISFSVAEGRIELLWGYSRQGALAPGDLIPMGPCQITQSEAELAAVYGFREHGCGDVPWLEATGNHLVQPDFMGDPVNAPTFVATLAGQQKESMTRQQ